MLRSRGPVLIFHTMLLVAGLGLIFHIILTPYPFARGTEYRIFRALDLALWQVASKTIPSLPTRGVVSDGDRSGGDVGMHNRWGGGVEVHRHCNGRGGMGGVG